MLETYPRLILKDVQVPHGFRAFSVNPWLQCSGMHLYCRFNILVINNSLIHLLFWHNSV